MHVDALLLIVYKLASLRECKNATAEVEGHVRVKLRIMATASGCTRVVLVGGPTT